MPPVAAVAMLAGRRRYPRTALAGVVAVAVVAVFATADPGATAVPVMMALFSLALHTDRKTWLVAAAITTCVLVVPILIVEPSMWPRIFGTVIWIALPPAIAEAVRNRRAYLAEVVERARRAEQTKEEEAKRQVAEERIRIARDLHDILAHSIAVVNVQSGVAAHVIDRDVDHARQALVHINDASDAALVELRTMLDVLRQDGDPQAPTRPAPMLGDVEELFVGLRSSGVTVDAEITDDLMNVPTEVSIVGYRILQEALTNVLKHAVANRVRVSVTINATSIRIEVVDDGVGSPTRHRRDTAGSACGSASTRWAAASPTARSTAATECSPSCRWGRRGAGHDPSAARRRPRAGARRLPRAR